MSVESLAEQDCVPCKGGVPPLKGEKLAMWRDDLGSGWKVVDEIYVEKDYPFPDFAQGLAFTNRVGELAERAGHHPDIHLAWGKVGIRIWTHKVQGLTEADFILAAKIEQLPR